MEHCNIIVASVHHRAVDGCRLVEAREAIGMTQQQFADKVGFSRQFISRIEAPGLHELTTNTARMIIKGLEE